MSKTLDAKPASKPRTTMRTSRFAALCLLVAAAAVLFCSAPARASALADAPPLRMTEEERMHVMRAFDASAPNTTAGKDTVWARRTYAPMHIHNPALAAYRSQIEKTFPEHSATFDVVFAAAENEVPWHADFDSLGPFDASLASIGREDFITVHANLLSPAGSESGAGRLRTVDSLGVAGLHYVSNRLTSSFGSLGGLTEPLAAALGARVRTHDGTPGAGNAFNNLKAHGVSAGAGRVSYVVRLVRKSVLLSKAKVTAAARGEVSTRRIGEFERFLPLFGEADEMNVGEFPWAQVEAPESDLN